MENHALQSTFIKACLSSQLISLGSTHIVRRSEIKKHIPTICLAIGIEINQTDTDVLIDKQGLLIEPKLVTLKTVTRSLLTVAMVSISIRYARSHGLPKLETVDWIREHFRKIEKQQHNAGCKPHRAFIDLYGIINPNIFILVPVPEQIKVQ
ncbi:hypothetical protein H7Y21_01765 [Arenimonas sp.]|nr:hypothetical protein [Candidatus Parcubacteria bacterium]